MDLEIWFFYCNLLKKRSLWKMNAPAVKAHLARDCVMASEVINVKNNLFHIV